MSLHLPFGIKSAIIVPVSVTSTFLVCKMICLLTTCFYYSFYCLSLIENRNIDFLPIFETVTSSKFFGTPRTLRNVNLHPDLLWCGNFCKDRLECGLGI